MLAGVPTRSAGYQPASRSAGSLPADRASGGRIACEYCMCENRCMWGAPPPEEGFDEWYAGLPLAGRRALTEVERAVLEQRLARDRKIAWAGTAAVALGLSIFLIALPAMVLEGLIPAIVLICVGSIGLWFHWIVWRLNSALRSETLRCFSARAGNGRHRDGRAGKISVLSQNKLGVLWTVILSDRNDLLLVNGHSLGKLELYRLGPPHRVAKFIPTKTRRQLADAERLELKHRLTGYRVFTGVYVLGVLGCGLLAAGVNLSGKSPLMPIIHLFPAALFLLMGIRGFILVLRIYPRLKRDMAGGEVVPDPDGTQRLFPSGTLWTDGDGPAAWRTAVGGGDGDVCLTLPGIGSGFVSRPEGTP